MHFPPLGGGTHFTVRVGSLSFPALSIALTLLRSTRAAKRPPLLPPAVALIALFHSWKKSPRRLWELPIFAKAREQGPAREYVNLLCFCPPVQGARRARRRPSREKDLGEKERMPRSCLVRAAPWTCGAG